MKNIFLLSALAISLLGCDRIDTPKTPSSETTSADRDITQPQPSVPSSSPSDPSDSEADRKITASLRKTLMQDDSLSSNAKNIKIITIHGVVTLRGPVSNIMEKDEIGKKAQVIEGVKRVENQLEISRMYYSKGKN